MADSVADPLTYASAHPVADVVAESVADSGHTTTDAVPDSVADWVDAVAGSVAVAVPD